MKKDSNQGKAFKNARGLWQCAVAWMGVFCCF